MRELTTEKFLEKLYRYYQRMEFELDFREIAKVMALDKIVVEQKIYELKNKGIISFNERFDSKDCSITKYARLNNCKAVADAEMAYLRNEDAYYDRYYHKSLFNEEDL